MPSESAPPDTASGRSAPPATNRVPRTVRKAASRARILAAAARQLRIGGLSGTDVAGVMQAAGLSHGALPVHFGSKADLVAQALRSAMAETRPRWVEPAPTDSWSARLQWLANRYLTRTHRDDPGTGCALAALGGETAMHRPALGAAYTHELWLTAAAIAGGGTDEQVDEALALVAICTGGLTLARAVEDEDLSRRILRVCRAAAGRLAAGPAGASSRDDHHSTRPGA